MTVDRFWCNGECCCNLLPSLSKHWSSSDDSLSWSTVLSTASFSTRCCCCCCIVLKVTSLLSDAGCSDDASTDGEVSVEVRVKCVWWVLLDFLLVFFFLWLRDVVWCLFDVSSGGECSCVVDEERWCEDLRECLCLSLAEADLDLDLVLDLVLDRCRGLWWDRRWRLLCDSFDWWERDLIHTEYRIKYSMMVAEKIAKHLLLLPGCRWQ